MFALRTILYVVVVFALLLSPSLFANVPQLINYQGYLTDTAGVPLNGTYSITISVYDLPVGGTALWLETLNINVDKGLFDATIGQDLLNPLDLIIFSNPTLYLGIKVGTDSEISPRTQFLSTPYAFRVSTIDGASGGTISGDVAIQSDLDIDGDLRVTGKVTIGPNHINTGINAFVAGDSSEASGNWSTVGGGQNNRAGARYSVVSGGGGTTQSDKNDAFGEFSTIGGGHGNRAAGLSATIGGGSSNWASTNYTTIAGGSNNQINGIYGSVGGGQSNDAGDAWATVAGGGSNTAGGSNSFIGGGSSNNTSAHDATIAGGVANYVRGRASFIGGGKFNKTSGEYSVVTGGGGPNPFDSNTVNGNYSFIGGGMRNVVSADYSTIVGGRADTIFATANHSYLFGISSSLTADSTFMVDMPHVRIGDETNGYELPNSDGTSGQVMTTDGAGQVSWNNTTCWNHDGSIAYTGIGPSIWTELDLSPIIGTGRKLVMLRIKSNLPYGSLSTVQFRTNGDIEAVGFGASLSMGMGTTGGSIRGGNIIYIMVETDDNGIVDWKIFEANSAPIEIWLTGSIG